MNISILEKAGIDYAGGVRRFMGRSDLYERILTKFLKDGTFDRIRSDYGANDLDQLLKDAHEFKGMCGNIALTRPNGAAHELVELLRAKASPDRIADAYRYLEQEYRTARDAISSALEV